MQMDDRRLSAIRDLLTGLHLRRNVLYISAHVRASRRALCGAGACIAPAAAFIGSGDVTEDTL